MPTQLREDLVKVIVVSGNQSQNPQQTQSFLSADTVHRAYTLLVISL